MHSIVLLKSSFLSSTTPIQFLSPSAKPSKNPKPYKIQASVTPDPWTLSDGNNPFHPKPKSERPKTPLSDDNARRIIKAKAKYLSQLRRNQGSQAQTPKWIKRTPEQMVRYLEDDRNGHLYGKHVVAAIKVVRSLSQRSEGAYDMRKVMGSFVGKLTFREMCVVLKEQKGWRQARDFFDWMKLQLSYRSSVIAYTILLRVYGQAGKIKLAEQTFLEMLEAGCEPDEVACGTMLCVYARWGRHKAMLSFYSAIQERKVILSVAVYNFMLSSLQKKSLHGKVVEIWRQMVDTGVAPNSFTYTVVINSLVKENLTEDAFTAFNKMRSFHIVPEEITYSLLISLCSKRGDRDEALKLYEDMRSQKLIPSNYTCATLLTIHYKNGDYSRALSLFSEMARYNITADEVIYGLLIKIYGKLGLVGDALRTFEEIKQLGLLTSEKTYVSLAQVHLRSGNFEKALDVMEQLTSAGIWFSRFSYGVLLKCYVMKEDLASAESTFHALSKTGHPDSGFCNDMLHLYLKLGLTEKAKDFILCIRKDQVELDEELLKTILDVYSKEGMLEEAEQLIQDICINDELFKSSGFVRTLSLVTELQSQRLETTKYPFEALNEPDSAALVLMLRLYLSADNISINKEVLKLLVETAGGLSVARDVSTAENLYFEVIKLGCTPENRATASLINAYGRMLKLENAQKVFAAVADSPAIGKQIYNSMIDAYSKCAKPEEAYVLFKELTKKGHDLGAVGISIIVNALSKSGKHQDAESIIQKALHDGLEIDTIAYNTFINAMLKAGKLHDASSIYEHMVCSGIAPSIQTYCTMISVYGRQRDLDKAVELFNAARNLGAALDEKTYSNLISCYGKAGKSHEAYRLFCKMQEEGISPGKVSYNIMMNAYATEGLYNETEELLQAMQRDGCSPDALTFLAIIQAYTQSLKLLEAEQTIISMQKNGISPTCAHFNHLMSTYAREGLITEAERMYKELFSAGLYPDLACYRTMLRGYLDYGHVKEGISFFEAISQSTEPDRFILSAAVHFYKSVGNEHEADRILHSMSSMGIQFRENLRVGWKVQNNSRACLRRQKELSHNHDLGG
ncbi:Pentatricopeptide repeat [Dillenia turbinata]|uniref:Pentatricopeptide repeat n=1 Tax=Dillenia turbinata TaxID=194707 RepID=A0AAN8VVI4_9MAGN